MKILMLHQHFKDPRAGGAIRSYYLAKALVDRGHRVVVLATHNGKNLLVEDVEGIQVHHLPIPYDNRFSFYARGKAFWRFVNLSLKEAAKFKDFDVCYAISVPLTVGIAARRIWSKYKMPYIFEVGDLWPDAPIQMGFVRNYLLRRILYRLESLIYRDAKSIVALSPAIQSAIETKCPGKVIHLIPNMADCDFYQPVSKSRGTESKYRVEGKFVVSYVGALGVANGLDFFLHCAKASMDADLPVHFILCGDGAMRDMLIKIADDLELNNLSILDFVNREEVKEIMSITDAVFVCYKDVPILETGSPNKLFDGLAAGKLIVVNFGGWIRNEIEAEACGIYVESQRPADFVRKISPFLRDQRLLRQFQQAARSLGERKYSRKELSKAFTGLFS